MPATKTYKGAIHLHTRYSDGSGKVHDIIKAAQNAGLDYIIISDHGELLPEQIRFRGWHKNVLVIYGVELSACFFGRRHFLALGVDSHLPYHKKPFEQKLVDIERDGGFSLSPGSAEYTVTLTTQGRAGQFDGDHTWFYYLAQEANGAWQVTSCGSGP